MNEEAYISKANAPVVDVVLYLRGDALNPEQVTSILGMDASTSRQKGDTWQTSSNKEVKAKIGLWKLTSRTDSTLLPDRIHWLRQQLTDAKQSPRDIPGVQDVELSIFVALDSDTDGAADYDSEFSAEDLVWLGEIGARVSFSFCYVRRESPEVST